MRYTRPKVAAILLAGLAGVALAAAAGAAAAAKPLYSGQLYGNIPNVTVRGVAAGAAPWVVKGTVEVTATSIVAKGTGLIVPPGYLGTGKKVPKSLVGTTAGVTAVGVGLSCAQGTTVLTATAPLSKSGAFDVEATVKAPSTCANPILLVGPIAKGKLVAWFASSNFLVYGLSGHSSSGWSSSGSKSKSWA